MRNCPEHNRKQSVLVRVRSPLVKGRVGGSDLDQASPLIELSQWVTQYVTQACRMWAMGLERVGERGEPVRRCHLGAVGREVQESPSVCVCVCQRVINNQQ